MHNNVNGAAFNTRLGRSTISPELRIRFGPSLLLCALVTLTSLINPDVGWGQFDGSSARWVAVSNAADKATGVFSFKKIIRLDSISTPFMVNVSADSRFVLYVNGKRVGDGPSRGDLGHWRYETLDIAPELRAGTNVIAARVWNFGDQSPTAQISLKPGFILWAAGTGHHEIDTNSTWEGRLEPAWTYTPPGQPVSSNVGPNEVLDGRLYDWNWMEAVDATRWTPAREIASPVFGTLLGPATSPTWMLTADKLPPMQYTEESAGTVVRSSRATLDKFPSSAAVIPAHTHASFLLDRKILTTAYPELKVSGGPGAKIRITYAEALFDDHGEKGNRSEIEGKHMDPRMLHDEFLPDGGSNRTFEPLWWRTWRYLQVDVDTQSEPLTLASLGAHYTAYPFEEKAYFRSDDTSLEKIWEVGWRTLQLDAHETYMDCPYWEQLQYIGDTRIESLVSYVVSGDARLALQALEAFSDSIRPSGLTQSRYPTRKGQVIPPFSLLWIGMLHDYWMYRPNSDAMKAMLPATRSALDYFTKLQRSDGLLGKLPQQGYNLWNFVDWTDPYPMGVPPEDADGGSVTLSLQLANALRDAADLEKAFGDATLANQYQADARQIAKVAYDKAWDPGRGLLSDVPSHSSFSEQANILGILTDSIPRTEQREVLQNILDREKATAPFPAGTPQIASASYYFRFYLSRAIDHAGMADIYLQTLGPWHHMLALGLSTWAEKPEPARSDAHAWSSHPNYDLLTLVAGIRPDSPGFGTVLIAPHLGELNSLEAAMPHPNGLIRVSYTRSGNTLKSHIELPAGLAGRFELGGRERHLHSGSQEFSVPLPTMVGRSNRPQQ